MAHSQSNKPDKDAAAPKAELPRRSFSIEFMVGVFTLLSVAAGAYLAVGLGDIVLFERGKYLLNAEFDNISGLKYGASVEIAGVQVGEVSNIKLGPDKCKAIIEMKLNDTIKIRDDDIFSIRTKGIIGDRYVKITPGGSDQYIEPNGITKETEGVVDIEDIIGKIVHNFSGSKDDSDDSKPKKD